jgi:hypothetical protein
MGKNWAYYTGYVVDQHIARSLGDHLSANLPSQAE